MTRFRHFEPHRHAVAAHGPAGNRSVAMLSYAVPLGDDVTAGKFQQPPVVEKVSWSASCRSATW